MSVRDYAAHLGISEVALSNLERKGERAQLRYETQQLLDADLAQSDDDVRQRFTLLLAGSDDAGRSTTKADSRPDVGTTSGLGGRSATRTRGLLQAMNRPEPRGLPYMPDPAVIQHFQGFLESSARVFVVKGSAGSGKTSLAYHLARTIEDADYQLHSVGPWDDQSTDLATEILRYASLPHADDPLLALEHASTSLSRPCVVIVDGINSPDGLDLVGRRVDAVLRQAMTDALKFLLIIRTPPAADLSSYPVLAASVYEPSPGARGCSYLSAAWDPAMARDVWDRSSTDDEPRFADLPSTIQNLARLPLYMRLLKSADVRTATEELSAFHLIDRCVRSVFTISGLDPDRAASTLGELAHAEAQDLVPRQLDARGGPGQPATDDPVLADPSALSPLLELSSDLRPTFAHDVIREYFLATQIAAYLISRDRSSAVAVLNDLARRAVTDATARGLFEFTVYALDDHSADLAAAFALAPTVAVDTTLPAMLRVAGTRFATPDVLRASARRRATDTTGELTWSLLAQRRLGQALGHDYVPWLLAALRQFGSPIWADVAGHIERSFDIEAATEFVERADLDAPEEATFVARHCFLFVHHEHDHAGLLDRLLGHLDWRVRAAIAEALAEAQTLSPVSVRKVIDQLAADDDYKVRAAVAKALGHVDPASAERHLPGLLTDTNWHVRASALTGTLRQSDASTAAAHARQVLDTVAADRSWRDGPRHVVKLLERLLVLGGLPSPDRSTSVARGLALFQLLREMRAGWSKLSEQIRDRLIEEGTASPSWLVRREAEALVSNGRSHGGSDSRAGVPTFRQIYRRLRGRRSIQVALDLADLDLAVRVAVAAARAGADFVEVGDPLIKTAGIGAVETVKHNVPHTTVIAEMMSADWGRDQVELAAEAGADAVLLIGPTSTASVSAAADAGRRLDTAVVLDVPPALASESWVRDMERAGVDGFAITTNIDLGVGVRQPLNRVRAVRGWTHLPVAVSGGFSATDYAIINSADWDIMIVGRSVAESTHPEEAAQQLVAMVRGSEGSR